MLEIPKEVAVLIIDSVGSNGIAPETGIEYFTVGLENYLNAIKDEYFDRVLKISSTVKLIVGTYGGGKSHFLYSVRNLAWNKNFAVSYVSLHENESPFHQVDSVYKAIVKSLSRPMKLDELLKGKEIGIESFLKYWYDSKRQEFESKGFSGNNLDDTLVEYSKSQIQGFDSTSFTNAIRNAFLALHEKRNEDFTELVLWLKGEGYDAQFKSKYGIFQKVEKQTAFSLIRSLLEFVTTIGFNGLVLLFDEAEKIPSLNSKQADLLASNLREFIDETKQTRLSHLLMLYAVPDEGFLQRRGQTYEALKQRFAKFFDVDTPNGTKIDLRRLNPKEEDAKTFLMSIGIKLSKIYEVAREVEFDQDIVTGSLSNIVEAVWKKRYGDISYIRIFVQSSISVFDRLRKDRISPINSEEADQMVANVLKVST
jgi:hypothetical protein